MRKKLLIFGLVIMLILCFSPALAEERYRQTAQGFLGYHNSPKSIASIDILHENSLNPDLPAIASGALVRLEGGGYILVASSRSLTPIKAYSLTHSFEDLPPAVQLYFRQEMEGNARVALEQDISGVSPTPVALQNEERWNFLLTFEPSRKALAYDPDTWLLTSSWNQNHPYNKFTPRMDGVPTYAGCVNTALAQIMKYYRYPDAARGVVTYDWNGQTLKAILFKSYNWDDIPENLDAATPAWQADQVASLISDIGIANKTMYGTDGSSARLETESLIRNFGYSTELSQLSNADGSEQFFQSLKAEIDADRPVLLSLPNHMVVADGYSSEQEDPTGRTIHLNMGWGGNHNDFYYLEAPVEAEDFSFTTNPGDLVIYFPVKPCEGADCNWISEVGADVAPVINTLLHDRILPAGQSNAERLFLDVRVESGESLTVSVKSSNMTAVETDLVADILTLSTGAPAEASKITVTAEAADKTTEQSFVVMTLDRAVGYGTAFDAAGTFTDQNAIYEHSAILDGACAITGDRGYSNQAFYTTVLNTEGAQVLGWSDEPLQATFEAGLYILAASLDNPETAYLYPYEPGVHEGYVVRVSCPHADDSLEKVAGLLDIDVSGIESPGEGPYLVIFRDYTGASLKSETVSHGAGATAPDDPERDGYIFAGWNLTFDFVTSDLEIAPLYYRYGDVNLDGRVDIIDAILLLRHAAGITELTDLHKRLGNVAGHADENDIGLRDGMMILKVPAGGPLASP